MKILLKKELPKSKRKKFIYRNDTYDWDVNYENLIREYVEGEFSYDKDNRKRLLDGEIIGDIIFDDIYNMFKISGLNICNENEINKAITNICKEKTFSKNKEERERKQQQKEQNKIDLPDKLLNYVKKTYGNTLSYNNDSKRVYINDEPMNKLGLDHILLEIQSNLEFNSVPKYKVRAIIDDVAKMRSFKEELIMDEDINLNWDILHNVDPKNWQDYFIRDSKGNIKNNTFNYALFLSFHPQFKGNILYNSFDKIESLRKYDKEYGKVVNKPIDDDLVHLIEAQIEQFFGDYNSKHVERALSVVLNNNSFHEIKQKFKQYEEEGWDELPRMHEIMIKYFGCEDCPQIREMTEVMLCGSVQRILEESPDAGTMFDYMGIQFGKQGMGKTKFMTRLYLGDKYASINPDINDDQKFTDLSNRAWLVLFDEMKSIGKADMGTVKSRITEQGANVRLSYGRRSKYYPRHVAFWGNTNYKGVLRDEGYERRFLCFECKNEKKYDPDWWEKNYTDYDIQQIWAETLKIYREKWENKIIHISKETEDWNYLIQIKHKIWVEDGRTDLELKEIFNYEHYNYPIYEPNQWRIWMKLLDGIKLGNESGGKHMLKFVKVNWILYRIQQRRLDWIIGMVEQLGWKKIHVNDEIFGNEDYFIRENLTFEEIKEEYLSYKEEKYREKHTENDAKYDETLPF